MKKVFWLLLAAFLFWAPLAQAYEPTSINATLGTALTATTNPDPTTLTTKNPFPTPFVDNQTVSAAWTSQAKKALFPLGIKDGQGDIPIKMHFVTSSAGATYTATVWAYDRTGATWSQAKQGSSVAYTGDTIDTIIKPGKDPIWIQLSSISAGTISIYFDSTNALAK